MSDSDRLTQLKNLLGELDDIDEAAFRSVRNAIRRSTAPFGVDEQGRHRIAFFDTKSFERQAFDRANQDEFDIHYIPGRLDADSAPAARGSRIACIFVNDIGTARVIETLADVGVELLALRCAGFNNVDLDACRQFGIDVVRVPAYSPHAVAEHTVGLMLTLNRKLHQAYLRNRAGFFVLDGLTGFDMHGKTAGVVGTGAIGRCVIEILLGFGCRVLAFDKFPDEKLRSHPGVTYTDLDSVLAESDIVSLHVPLFPETHHIINAESIAQMRRGAMIINTSRGGLVDAAALIEGLKTGQIGSAGLDVYEEEAGVFFHDLSGEVLTDDVLARLLTFNNVVVTSHQGFLTHEALSNIADTTLSNVREFTSGKRNGELTHAVSR